MGESQEHICYVHNIHDIAKKYIVGKYHPYIHVDAPGSDLLPPQNVEGYRPDVYFNFDRTLLIGEAKTLKDFETRHSLEQIHSYVVMCENHAGNAYLIIFVPWTLSRTAKKIIRKFRTFNNNLFVVVIADNTGHIDLIS